LAYWGHIHNISISWVTLKKTQSASVRLGRFDSAKLQRLPIRNWLISYARVKKDLIIILVFFSIYFKLFPNDERRTENDGGCSKTPKKLFDYSFPPINKNLGGSGSTITGRRHLDCCFSLIFDTSLDRFAKQNKKS
jgi:hypothetical protein